MKIIPTFDILDGLLMDAVGGQRDKYQPLGNVDNSSNPLEVIFSLKKNFDFEDIYIADLDGIISGLINVSLINRICKNNDLRFWVDAGIDNIEKAQILYDNGVDKVIIGTETLTNLNLIRELSNIFGMSSFSVSLDIRYGKIISKYPELHGLHPFEAALILEKEDVEQLLFIDISRVGTARGCNWKLVKETIESVSIPIIVGGGIGSTQDILKLKEIGAEAVLVGSILHHRILTKSDIDLIMKI
jgi:phosphoribosylformimino-5-aminoimidazole carboxamide ribotide isomerase